MQSGAKIAITGALRYAFSAVLGGLLLVGCASDRDRPTGPSGPVGNPELPATPLILIDKPAADTVVTDGDQVLIEGSVAAAAGLDSLFVEIIGSNFSFPPQSVSGNEVGFQFPLQTQGLAGTRLEIRVSAVDLDGNSGGPVIRVLSVQ